MNIQSLYTTIGLDGIITELEAALQIDGKDYEEASFDTVIGNVKQRINRMYQIDLSLGKVNDISFESGIYKAAVSLFIDNVASIHARYVRLGRLRGLRQQVTYLCLLLITCLIRRNRYLKFLSCYKERSYRLVNLRLSLLI